MFNGAETVLARKELDCKLYIPWQTGQPMQMSFGLAKQSVYYEAINYQLMRLVENGIWRV